MVIFSPASAKYHCPGKGKPLISCPGVPSLEAPGGKRSPWERMGRDEERGAGWEEMRKEMRRDWRREMGGRMGMERKGKTWLGKRKTLQGMKELSKSER